MTVDRTAHDIGESGPVETLSVGGDVALPFACRHEDSTGDPAVILKPRAIQCALSRVCGVCGNPQTRPLAFVGSEDEADAREFAFPPCHLACADAAARSGRGTVVLTTAGFDLTRPKRRGGPVSFRPNSVLDRIAISADV